MGTSCVNEPSNPFRSRKQCANRKSTFQRDISHASGCCGGDFMVDLLVTSIASASPRHVVSDGLAVSSLRNDLLQEITRINDGLALFPGRQTVGLCGGTSRKSPLLFNGFNSGAGVGEEL